METTETKTYAEAYTMNQIAEIAPREASKFRAKLAGMYRNPSRRYLADFMEEGIDRLASAFVAGAVYAMENMQEGKAVRSYQYSTGKWYMVKEIKAIREEIAGCAHGKPHHAVDHTGGAFDADENGASEGVTLAAQDAPALDREEMGRKAEECLSDLAAQTQQAIRRHVIDGLTMREVAEEMGITAGRVCQIVQEGMAKLRRKLAD